MMKRNLLALLALGLLGFLQQAVGQGNGIAQAQVGRNTPREGTEDAVRNFIQSLQNDKPNLGNQTEKLAAETARQLPRLISLMKALGPMISVSFDTVGPGGADIYEVHFAHGDMEWRINPLIGDGKIDGMSGKPVYTMKHLFTVGRRQLNMVCIGDGSPTVVFLQGMGANITDWRRIREPVSSFARECFYDRANVGYSDVSEMPVTAENVVADLHALLHSSEIKTPVVLVGHSLGGLYATLYADKYLDDIAGLVLVDPSFAGQFDHQITEQDHDQFIVDDDKWKESMRECGILVERDSLSETEMEKCGIPGRINLIGAGLTPPEIEYIQYQMRRPSYYSNVISEYDNFSPKGGRGPSATTVDGDQELKNAKSFGDLPMIVLTAENTFDDESGSQTAKLAMTKVWKLGHEGLAARSSRGIAITVPHSGHGIHWDQPEAVIDAIRNVVLAAQDQKKN